MREKIKYRIGMFCEFCLWLIVCVFVVFAGRLSIRTLWLDVPVIIAFVSIAIGSLFSPRFRRYIRKQATGSRGIPEGELVGKYTILEDDIERIREASAKTMCESHPRLSLSEWRGKRWEAIRDPEHPGFAWALMPGMFRDTVTEERINRSLNLSGEVSIELCVVAFWNGRGWESTPFFIPGDEIEALPFLKTRIDEGRDRQ